MLGAKCPTCGAFWTVCTEDWDLIEDWRETATANPTCPKCRLEAGETKEMLPAWAASWSIWNTDLLKRMRAHE